MTIVELTHAAVDAGEPVLIQWLKEEREGKNRKGALKALNEALEKSVHAEPA